MPKDRVMRVSLHVGLALDAAQELERLANEQGQSQTAVLEALIRAAGLLPKAQPRMETVTIGSQWPTNLPGPSPGILTTAGGSMVVARGSVKNEPDPRGYRHECKWSCDDAVFIVTYPAFPGLSAFGKTEKDALREGQIALRLFIKSYEEDGIRLPDFDASQAETQQRVIACNAFLCLPETHPAHYDSRGRHYPTRN